MNINQFQNFEKLRVLGFPLIPLLDVVVASPGWKRETACTLPVPSRRAWQSHIQLNSGLLEFTFVQNVGLVVQPYSCFLSCFQREQTGILYADVPVPVFFVLLIRWTFPRCADSRSSHRESTCLRCLLPHRDTFKRNRVRPKISYLYNESCHQDSTRNNSFSRQERHQKNKPKLPCPLLWMKQRYQNASVNDTMGWRNVWDGA
jgi:hypothetical protein